MSSQQHQHTSSNTRTSSWRSRLHRLFVLFCIVYPLFIVRRLAEWYTARQYKQRQKERCLAILHSTEEYQTWRSVASVLDTFAGYDEWKCDEKDKKDRSNFDEQKILETAAVMDRLEGTNSEAAMGTFIRTGLARNIYGLGCKSLHKYYTGTKSSVENYYESVERLIGRFARSSTTTPRNDEDNHNNGPVDVDDDNVSSASSSLAESGATPDTVSARASARPSSSVAGVVSPGAMMSSEMIISADDNNNSQRHDDDDADHLNNNGDDDDVFPDSSLVHQKNKKRRHHQQQQTHNSPGHVAPQYEDLLQWAAGDENAAAIELHNPPQDRVAPSVASAAAAAAAVAATLLEVPQSSEGEDGRPSPATIQQRHDGGEDGNHNSPNGNRSRKQCGKNTNADLERTVEQEHNGASYSSKLAASTTAASCTTTNNSVVGVCRHLSPKEKFLLLKDAAQSYGRTALMLSGGASLGMYHSGVVRALWSANLLPKIISGSSAGAIIAAIFCTRTDEEVDDILASDTVEGLEGKVSLDAFDSYDEPLRAISTRVWRFIKTGAFMDVEVLMSCMRKNCGDATFQEAYERTGRILNIAVASVSREGGKNAKSLVLNYVTAPHVMIWTAVAASCAYPRLFTSVQLLQKNPVTNAVSHFLPGQLWNDGSICADLPEERLAELFNANFFIVSQVNPHVAPFIRPSLDHMVHKKTTLGWLQNLWFSACEELRYWVLKGFRNGLISLEGENELLFLQLNQRYSGDVTIRPIRSFFSAFPDYVNLTTNPTKELLQYVTGTAQRRTWPHINMIHSNMRVELALQKAMNQLRQQFASVVVDEQQQQQQSSSLP